MSHRFPYDQGFDPPAPVLPLRWRHPRTSAAVLVPMLVDTGADRTLLPERIAHQLSLPAVARAIVERVEGRSGVSTVYAAMIEGAGLKALVRVIGDGTEARLGRDLLARLTVRLDGPAQQLGTGRSSRRA